MTSVRAMSGLTLIEMFVVIALVAIIAAMAGPRLSTYLGQQRLKGAAAELSSDLQFARSESVQRNAPVTVTFNANGYSIAQGATNVKTVALSNGNAVTSGSTVVVTYEPVRATATVTNGPAVELSNPAVAGSLRFTVGAMGRVSLCAPSGTLKGYTTC